MKNNEESFKEFTTPCSVFMTFENEEGICRALEYHNAVKADPDLASLLFWLDDEEIEI